MSRKEDLLNYLRSSDDAFCFRNDKITILPLPYCERPQIGTGYDIFGVHWTDALGASHYTSNQKPVYDDIEDWQKQVRFPDIEKFNWDILKQAISKIDRDSHYIQIILPVGPLERATTLTSMDNCLMDAISCKEDFKDLIDALADFRIKIIDKIYQIAQPDLWTVHDDWGTSKSTLFSPTLWRETVKPATERIYQKILQYDGVICQHSCGNLESILPDMIEMGCEVWEGQADCNDIDKLKQLYGDKLLFNCHKMHITADITKVFNFRFPNNGAFGTDPYDEYPEFLFK